MKKQIVKLVGVMFVCVFSLGAGCDPTEKELTEANLHSSISFKNGGSNQSIGRFWDNVSKSTSGDVSNLVEIRTAAHAWIPKIMQSATKGVPGVKGKWKLSHTDASQEWSDWGNITSYSTGNDGKGKWLATFSGFNQPQSFSNIVIYQLTFPGSLAERYLVFNLHKQQETVKCIYATARNGSYKMNAMTDGEYGVFIDELFQDENETNGESSPVVDPNADEIPIVFDYYTGEVLQPVEIDTPDLSEIITNISGRQYFEGRRNDPNSMDLTYSPLVGEIVRSPAWMKGVPDNNGYVQLEEPNDLQYSLHYYWEATITVNAVIPSEPILAHSEVLWTTSDPNGVVCDTLPLQIRVISQTSNTITVRTESFVPLVLGAGEIDDVEYEVLRAKGKHNGVAYLTCREKMDIRPTALTFDKFRKSWLQPLTCPGYIHLTLAATGFPNFYAWPGVIQ